MPVLVGQLSTRKWHYCAVFVKSVRFGRECKQSISNIFLICHILWHFKDGCHWPWEFHAGQKLKHAPISLKIPSNCSSCHKDSKNVSFVHLQCLVFELYKIIALCRSKVTVGPKFVQGVKIQNCFDSHETYLKLFVLTQIFRKRIVLYT